MNYEDAREALRPSLPLRRRQGSCSDGNDSARSFYAARDDAREPPRRQPDDERYTGPCRTQGRSAFVEREIEVLADEYVDPSFGTGVLKVTTAHDPNDFEIGRRLGLPSVTS